MQPTPLESLALSIKRLQYRNYRTADARLAPLGISLVQWGALREIERNPGLCMHRLAELTFNSDQAFGTLVTRLLRLKLVERQPGAGRANIHRLTPRGKTLFTDGRRCLRQIWARNFASLDAAECARLQDLLDKVLGEDTDDSRGLRQPPTGFRKTLVGLVPEPGQPGVHAGRQHPKSAPRRTASVQARKTNPTAGGAN